MMIKSIKIIAVGGCGNAVQNYLLNNYAQSIDASVEFFVVDANLDISKVSSVPNKIDIYTQEVLSGINFENYGYSCAKKHRDTIEKMLEGADKIILLAGMGGKIASSAVRFIAEVAKEKGIATFFVVTKPLLFEGEARRSYAENAIAALVKVVDYCVVIDHQKEVFALPKNMKLGEVFGEVNKLMAQEALALLNLTVSK